MDYFPHDTKAMSDDKLLALRLSAGLEAVATYWAIIEKIYADEKPFDTSETNVEATSVLLRLGFGFPELETYVSAMVSVGLLVADENNPKVVMSERAKLQMEELNKKRETARQNGKLGGRKPNSGKRGNQRKTNVGSNTKPKSVTYKTLNGIGFDKQNQIPTAGAGAGGEEPPPRPSGKEKPQEIFDAADKAARDMAATSAQIEQWEAEAVACPQSVLDAVNGGAA